MKKLCAKQKYGTEYKYLLIRNSQDEKSKIVNDSIKNILTVSSDGIRLLIRNGLSNIKLI